MGTKYWIEITKNNGETIFKCVPEKNLGFVRFSKDIIKIRFITEEKHIDANGNENWNVIYDGFIYNGQRITPEEIGIFTDRSEYGTRTLCITESNRVIPIKGDECTVAEYLGLEREKKTTSIRTTYVVSKYMVALIGEKISDIADEYQKQKDSGKLTPEMEQYFFRLFVKYKRKILKVTENPKRNTGTSSIPYDGFYNNKAKRKHKKNW